MKEERFIDPDLGALSDLHQTYIAKLATLCHDKNVPYQEAIFNDDSDEAWVTRLLYVVGMHKRIVDKLTSIFYDENAEFNDRMAAGVMLVNAELDLWPEDLCSLKKDCLTRNKKGKTIVTFRAKDKLHPHIEATYNFFCSPKLKKTMKDLLDLRKQGSRAKECPYLLAPDFKGGSEDATKRTRTVWLSAKLTKFFGHRFQLKDLGAYANWKHYLSDKSYMYIEDVKDLYEQTADETV